MLARRGRRGRDVPPYCASHSAARADAHAARAYDAWGRWAARPRDGGRRSSSGRSGQRQLGRLAEVDHYAMVQLLLAFALTEPDAPAALRGGDASDASEEALCRRARLLLSRGRSRRDRWRTRRTACWRTRRERRARGVTARARSRPPEPRASAFWFTGPPQRALAEDLLDPVPERARVRATLRLGLDDAHDLTHVFHRGRADLLDRRGYDGLELLFRERLGKVFLNDPGRERFLGDELIAAAVCVRLDASRRCLRSFESRSIVIASSTSTPRSSTSFCLIAAVMERIAASRSFSFAFIAVFMSALRRSLIVSCITLAPRRGPHARPGEKPLAGKTKRSNRPRIV